MREMCDKTRPDTVMLLNRMILLNHDSFKQTWLYIEFNEGALFEVSDSTYEQALERELNVIALKVSQPMKERCMKESTAWHAGL